LVLAVLILRRQMAVLEITLFLTQQLLAHIQVVLLPMVAVLVVKLAWLVMLVALVVGEVEDLGAVLVYLGKEMQVVLDSHQLQVHIKVAVVAVRELLGYSRLMEVTLLVLGAQE